MNPVGAAARRLQRVDDAASHDGGPPSAVELTIVVPTRNEEGNVPVLVERLERALGDLPAEVVFVDDSDDGTPVAVDRAGRDSRLDVRLVHRTGSQRRGGLGGAVVEGIRRARAPWVCVMDADLQHPPEAVRRLVAKSREGDLDLVVASRFCEDGGVGEFGPFRRALSSVSSGLAALCFPGRLRGVSDPMSGFFLVRRGALDPDVLQPEGFKILLEILVRTPGLRRGEVPFEFGTRHAGDSKAGAREAGRYLVQLWRLRLADVTSRVGRFGVVGVTGLAVNTLALALMADVAGIYYVVAAVLATQASTLWNFALTEIWVFADREHRRRGVRRLAMFFAINNAALGLRIPVLIGLTAGLGVHYVASNLVSLALVFVLRFTLADLWIWAKADELEEGAAHNYDIHGLVTIASDVRLPELERFRVPERFAEPAMRVRIGPVRRDEETAAGDGAAGRITYVEGRAGLGFGARIEIGERIDVLASPLLRRSPHVLYTNIVEPILRWTVVQQGYALVHAACMARDGRAYLITARTDTGKTTTCLRALDGDSRCTFLSDDLTLLSPDGRVLTYPKPLTISRHTLRAVKRNRLSRRERAMLVYQSRLHSRSGRRFALLLAKTRMPAATVNAIVQLLVPPPKYHVDRLVPGVMISPEAEVAGMMVIQRGGEGNVELAPDEALEILLANCEDAYGFPPYSEIEHFLHSRNGHDLRRLERETIARGLAGTGATLLRSETMDWHLRVARIVAGGGVAPAAAATNGNGHNGTGASVPHHNGNVSGGSGLGAPNGNGAVHPGGIREPTDGALDPTDGALDPTDGALDPTD